MSRAFATDIAETLHTPKILGRPKMTNSGSHAISRTFVCPSKKRFWLSLNRAVISVANGNHAFISKPGVGLMGDSKTASGNPGSCRRHFPKLLNSDISLKKSIVLYSIKLPTKGESFEIILQRCNASLAVRGFETANTSKICPCKNCQIF